MTPEEHKEWKARIEKARTLVARLEVGDELHREAAERIKEMRKQWNEDLHEANYVI